MYTRIRPVPFEEWPEGITSGIPALEGSTSPPPVTRLKHEQKGRNAIGVLAHHPDLARAWMQFTSQILRKSTLSDRQRELLILRVAVIGRSPYQWIEHVPIARRSGLDDDDIARIAFGPDAPYWSPLERALLKAADELLSDGDITDPTWQSMAEELSERQLLDVLFTVGAYLTNCIMAKACRIRPDATTDKDSND